MHLSERHLQLPHLFRAIMAPAALLPNPYTSLAWLPADIATQVEISRYICCAVFGVSTAISSV